MELRSFVNKEAHRLWEGRHLSQSHAKLIRFCDYKDFGRRRVDMFGLGDIYDFLDHLSSQGLTDNTLNHYSAALSVVFNHAVDLGALEAAPKIKWKKVKSGRPRYMTREEITGLFSFLGSHKHWWMRHFVTIGLYTGMRLGEILSITDNHIVKTDDGTWIHLLETKNGDERWVPANEKVIEALAALDNRPNKYFHRHDFYKTWDQARSRVARNDKHFVFHTLRHTAATNMANDLQVNTLVIGKLLGHRNVQTTMKYVHVKPTELQSIAKRMQQGDGA